MNEGIFNNFNEKEQVFEFTKGNQIFIRDMGTVTDQKVKNQGTTTKKECQDFEQSIDQNELQQIKEKLYIMQFDQNKLDQFLKRVLPTVIKELDEQLNLKKYHSYKPISDVQKKETELVYILTNAQNKSIELEKKLEIIEIQWNSNGLMIAASYGCLEHMVNAPIHLRSIVGTFSKGISNHKNQPQQLRLILVICACSFIQLNQIFQQLEALMGNYIFMMFLHIQNEYQHRESITAVLWLLDESVQNQYYADHDFGLRRKSIAMESKKGNGEFSLQSPLKGCYLVRKRSLKPKVLEEFAFLNLMRILFLLQLRAREVLF